MEDKTTIHAGLAAGYHCAATAGENLSCFWPDCECVSDDVNDQSPTTNSALLARRAQTADIRQQIQILSNTIASGEANEAACYEALGWLTDRLNQLQDETRNAPL